MTQLPKLKLFIAALAVALPLFSLWANTDGKEEFQISRTGDLYTLKADDVPIAVVLAELRKLSELELKVDPSLDMRVTADLKDVAIEDVLAAVSSSRALVYERSEENEVKIVEARLSSEQTPVINAAVNANTGEAILDKLKQDSVLPPGILTNTKRPLHELRNAETPALLFSGAILDTRALVEEGRGLEIPADFRAAPDTETYIVQFNHTVSTADREAIEALGAKVSHFVPNRAYAVTVELDQLAALRNLPGVYVVEPYHPYFKMSAAVRERMLGGEQKEQSSEPATFTLMTFAGSEIEADLAAAGVDVTDVDSDGRRQVMTFEADAGRLMEVLRMDGVQWIEPFAPAAVMNDLGVRRMRVPSLKKLHPTLTGEGVTVAVTDSGVDFQHQAFSDAPGPTSTNINTRITHYEYRAGPNTEGLPGDVDGHGSHVAGSILGNGAFSTSVISSPGSDGPPYKTNQFAGVAPRARLVMLEDFNSLTDSEQAEISYQKGARISNNSWGANLFEYGTASALWDAFVRDADSTAEGNQDFIVFFAAGNSGQGVSDGSGGTPNTIGTPGNAKNVITMGALEQPRFANNIMGPFFGDGQYFSDLETDSDWQVARYSSRGPVTTTDLRVKPDLMAPGSYVLSVQSHVTSPDDFTSDFSRTDYRFGNVNTGTNYAYFSGTSMATPLGAGAAALIYQHLTNTLGTAPSPALMKALLVAGARTVNSLAYRRPIISDLLEVVDDGWGVIDVNRSVNGPQVRSTDALIMLDQSQTVPLETDDTYTQQITLGAEEGGLRVVLAYTDKPGTPGAGVQLVNNLDLIIFGPNGAIYRGNLFDSDGVHALRLSNTDGVFYDQYNNVEAVTIPAGGAGTYSIRVYGRQIPDGPQDYALVVQKGIGYQGRTEGNFPSVALDTNGYPVVAYSYDSSMSDPASSNLTRQIHVRRWVGSYGDGSELGQWKRIEDQWFGIRDSLDFGGISKTVENSEHPSVAVKGENIYVAWEEGTQLDPQSAVTNQRVFLRHFNGSNWVELANSAQGFGVSKNTNGFDAIRPVVAVMGDGSPVVAWLQGGAPPNLTRVFLARWNGSSWVGLANSHIDGVPTLAATKIAEELSIAINGSGNPVLAFKEITNPDGIVVLQWTGAAWGNISPADSPPFVERPKITSGPGANNLALAWVQTFGSNPGIFESYQVYAASYNGVWSAVGGSQTFPGLSAVTNLTERPLRLDIGVGFNNSITVAWQGGTNAGERTIMARRWKVGAASWADISGSSRAPGITGEYDTYSTPDIVIDPAGLPIIAFVNSPAITNLQEIQTYTLIDDRSPPSFAGLQTAIGGTNGNVALSWLPATDDIATNIIYRIYRGTQTFACGTTPSCNVGNVFSNLIATVTNATSFNVTGLVPNFAYCFGVRAGNPNDLFELNEVVRSAGPVTGAGDNDGDCLVNGLEIIAGTEPCVKDSDGDGMWDGWEWTFSTNNINKTNTISILNTNKVYLSPIDNGFDNIRTPILNDGTLHNLADADPDGDGASNFEEFQYWFNNGASCTITNLNLLVGPNPTAFDTDGDSLPDGWEMLTGLNPVNPADAANDNDGDGLTNLEEYQNGSDPINPDTDGDGLIDGDELNVYGTSPVLADSDADGLDDGDEITTFGSDPRHADSNNSFVSDGAVFQLGLDPTGSVQNFNMLLHETFEAGSPTRNSWSNYAPNAALPFAFWHLTTVEPDTNSAASPLDLVYFNSHTTTTSYRAARDLTGTNLNANYSGFGSLAMALQAPTITNTPTVNNLHISWLEWFESEPNADFCVVQVRASGNTNWFNVTTADSGRSGVTNVNDSSPAQWVRRSANISGFAGQNYVQLRFLFTANTINNQFKGWFVDDVRVYEAVTIFGWVRDINGRAIEGAKVRAIGQGGVTNGIGGHRYVLPGLQFGEALTAKDGSYFISDLPAGNYYVKAEAASHIAEFSDGLLFSGVYAFGAGLRPGVADRDLVSTNGIVSLLAAGDIGDVNFELEQGSGRGCLGVAMSTSATNLPVRINNLSIQVWNGITNLASAGFTNYLAAPDLSVLTNNRPDWLLNPVKSTLFCDISSGVHIPYVGTNHVFYPLPEVLVKDGERTLIQIGTNAAQSRIFVTAENLGSYQVRLDGILLTNRTPAVITVRAGLHEVGLVSPSPAIRFGTIRTRAPIAGRSSVEFTSNMLLNATGRLLVKAVDINGNNIQNLPVYINGTIVGAQDISLGTTTGTPVEVLSLRPGSHNVTVGGNGYKLADNRLVTILPGITNSQTFVMYEADRDYDLVGDATEILGYTNIFLFHRDDDPDFDSLNNLGEFELFRLFNVRVNPFLADTDQDNLDDGDELGYNGVSNTLALSTLFTNAFQFENQARVLFVGRYLDGIDYFGAGSVPVSIEGDRFVGTITHPLVPVPTPGPALIIFTNIVSFPSNVAINAGWNLDSVVFADGRPDLKDTDGDGMWDGYEFSNGVSTLANLDLIESAKSLEDPDADGLSNIREFRGINDIADLLDSSSPSLADSDGDYIPDGWEYTYNFNPNDSADAFTDLDGDGLVQLGEFLSGTDPLLTDTDADFLPDFEEVVVFGSNPLDIDTDDDGLLDGREVWDKDLDGVQDGGFFSSWAGGDLDNDGLIDGPTDWDTDGDGMPDGFEVITAYGILRDPSLNPYDPTDGDEDPDGDGLTSLQEYLVLDGLYGNPPDNFGFPAVWDYSTDPFNADSDGDGMPDGFEVLFGLHPVDPVPCPNGDGNCTRYAPLATGGDPDLDGLWNFREYNIRFLLNVAAPTNAVVSQSTHPWNPDTDGDGLQDGEEDRSFRSHPIVQDADLDRLPDGTALPGKSGEIESAPRVSEYALVITNLTWIQAKDAAAVSHADFFGSAYSNIIGHLAIISTPFEMVEILALPGLTETNAIVGNLNPEFAFGGKVYSQEVVSALGVITNVSEDSLVSAYIIEWEDIPVATNNYDEALNDLWQLVWPADPTINLPEWKKVEVSSNSPMPEARWGAAMSYVPVFETKNPRNDNTGKILLDNRQLVLIGGRDGVNRFKDVWEYVVRSNSWIRSSQPLAGALPGYVDGLSEVHAIPVFGYKNTKVSGCPCDKGYNCDGSDFGLPKNRPWSGGAAGGESLSFDWTMIFGGWSEGHGYTAGHGFYKSTDDPRSITEDLTSSQGVTEYINGSNLTATAQNDDGVDTFMIGNPPGPIELDGNTGGDLEPEFPTGFSALQFPNFALNSGCDQIDYVVIKFSMENPAVNPINATITAEFTFETGSSDESYTSELNTREPSSRLTLGTYYNTTNIPIVIPAAQNVVTVDVTTIVRELAQQGSWNSATIGFVIDASGDPDFALVRTERTKIEATYKPSYKVDASWKLGGILTEYTTQQLTIRKSSGFVHDFDEDRLVMFGGIDGNVVYNDTHVGEMTFTGGFDPIRVNWSQKVTVTTPEARWGHSMVYDSKNKRVMMFGGFDKNHRPLNDLWFYSVVDDTWTEFTDYRDDQIPQPRGGASMVYYGDYDYDRAIDEYCMGGNKQKVVLFGGTDGNTYFNDTWVFDDNQGRWILISPVGEHSISPPPRAFAPFVFAQNARATSDLGGESTYRVDSDPPCATPVAFLFGGRSGAIPTGRDTDFDLVDDGTEHELGGQAAGRDPRVNALVITNRIETIPFSFKRIGSVRPTYALTLLPSDRGAVANFESLRHDRPDVEHGSGFNVPYESNPDQWTLTTYSPFGNVGVDAVTSEDYYLWWHQHGGENPFDERDVWQLGRPDNTFLGSNAIPRYAYSGRWCYGTELKGTYPNNAMMELYSPLFNLTLPSLDSTSISNANSFFLVFHEWLDLADANDVVRIEAVRPQTNADVFNRKTGLNRPIKPVLPNRNNLFNTTGKWRRTIVPLDVLGNEPTLYLRFTLQSDSNNVRAAGGWYVDDVSIIQGSELSGIVSSGGSNVSVCLLGEQFNDNYQQCTVTTTDGYFEFGLLPLGSYSLLFGGTTYGPYDLNGPELNINLAGLSSIVLTWTSPYAELYQIDYTTNILMDEWWNIGSVTGGAGSTVIYTDLTDNAYRLYRVTTSNTNPPAPEFESIINVP